MKRKISFITLACVLVVASRGFASPEIPGAEQAEPIAIVNATVFPMSSEPLPNATLLFEEGKIVAVGQQIEIPENAQRIDATGKHVYPGLINAGGQIGLIEINSVKATDDSREVGTLNPNVKAQVAVNPDSEIIPVTRANGVLMSLSVPRGGLISGTSALLQLDGWTWEEMTLSAPAAMHIQWPNVGSSGNKDPLQTLVELFESVDDYAKAIDAGGAVDVRLDAMLPVVQGKLPVVAHANTTLQIQSAVAFAAERKLPLIIFGGYDAPYCARLLKQHDVPVIVSSVYRLPRRRSDAFDESYTIPERLRQAGVKFCIAGVGRFSAASLRNLPYHAATAAAYGLSEEEALKAITLYPAQILGVADQVGSLEVGKHATLIVSDGSPLATETQVEHAFIQGRPVDLESRHTRLWKKYRVKYDRIRDSQP